MNTLHFDVYHPVLSHKQYAIFKDINNITYSSIKQYLAYQKAVLFNDIDSANSILKVSKVPDIKLLESNIKNVDDVMWMAALPNLLETGLFLKYSQNEKLKTKLCEMEHDHFVADLPDPYLGVGTNGTGKNLLGNTVMQIKTKMMKSNECAFH